VQPPLQLFADPAPAAPPDGELERVAERLLELDPFGGRVANVLRETFDQLLDGQRTGRWDYRDLRKTEKTHMGTLVEINLHREFDFEDGHEMDYRIADAEVDCKFSQSPRGWQIPLEADGHLCLVLWADDDASLWSGGLIRISDEVLRPGGNRDRKRTVSELGLARIRRLWHEQPLPENLLLQLDSETRSRIFAFPGKRNGQRRTNELFRLVQGRLISRTAVLTVAQQDDPPKRVRDARLRLQTEGIIILGHQGDHPRIARTLGLPVPVKGQWVSVRLTPNDLRHDHNRVSIVGCEYRIATSDDVPVAAPLLDARRGEV
jgi:hypothetical protein